MEKYLFEPIDTKVIYNYSIDTIKVLIEDKEFSENILMTIDADDFKLYNFKALIEALQSCYTEINEIPDYDSLIRYIKNSDLEDNDTLYYINECREKTLEEDRVNQIKESLPLYSRYILLAKIANIIEDAAKAGYTTDKNFCKIENNILGLVSRLNKFKRNAADDTNEWI